MESGIPFYMGGAQRALMKRYVLLSVDKIIGWSQGATGSPSRPPRLLRSPKLSPARTHKDSKTPKAFETPKPHGCPGLSPRVIQTPTHMALLVLSSLPSCPHRPPRGLPEAQ